jgi:biopolymer transport protein ExbD
MLLKKRAFKLHLPQGEMNVVSLMDILTTLLFFLLTMAAFTRLGGLEGQGLLNNYLTAESTDKKPVFTLQVVFHTPQKASIWLGPIADLRPNSPEELSKSLRSTWQGDEARGFMKDVQAVDWATLLASVQKELLPVKRGFPSELGAVAAFTDAMSSQQMIDAMASLRSLPEKEAPIDVINAVGQPERTRVLFPALILSEWVEPSQSTPPVAAPASDGEQEGRSS